jgi:hypothetical protein
VPEGHDPDPVGRPWLAVVIFGVILAAAGIFVFGVTIGVALAAGILAVALVIRGAATSILRKL